MTQKFSKEEHRARRAKAKNFRWDSCGNTNNTPRIVQMRRHGSAHRDRNSAPTEKSTSNNESNAQLRRIG